ncbi:hypothetical protein ACTMU2_31985 [Cupriavidus basilensis]
MPDANLGLTNPSGQMHAQSFDDVEESPEQLREKLNMIINKIRKFHESIRQQYKAPTYAHYGAQGIRNSNGDAGGFFGTGLLADKDRNTWGEVAWEGAEVGSISPEKFAIVADDGNGTLEHRAEFA